MKRVTVVLGVVAVLTSSCGGNDLPAGVASTLQDQVAVIRHDAEIGRPGYARNDLNELVAMVRSRLDRSLIDQQRATEILAAANAVAAQLSLLPRPSAAASPSPPPVEEHDKGKRKDKDHDKEHGND
jgi:hypothetical protein